MSIWVDADACPSTVRDILCRAAIRSSTQTTFVANQFLNLPKSPYVKMLQVPAGFDIADHEIVARCAEGDLVITSDIPLAAEVIEKGALVVTARGGRYTTDNIKSKLNMRDFMETMRSSGIQTGGPPPLSQTDRQKFANFLDKYLAGSLG